MDVEAALAILNSGDFAQLVGAYEGVQLEFKGAPYQLAVEWHRWELAKDVAGLANAQGGLIVLGVSTESEENSIREKVVAARPFTRELVNLQQHRDLITQRIYPRLTGLSIEFKPTATEPDEGLVVIQVPPQPDVNKYFLVSEPVREGETSPIRGWLFGVSVRSADQVDSLTPGELHTLIRDGRRHSLEPMEATTAPSGHVPADRLLERLTEVLEDQ